MLIVDVPQGSGADCLSVGHVPVVFDGFLGELAAETEEFTCSFLSFALTRRTFAGCDGDGLQRGQERFQVQRVIMDRVHKQIRSFDFDNFWVFSFRVG
jgi:hypothetical protein